jgi:hypothetical protein
MLALALALALAEAEAEALAAAFAVVAAEEGAAEGEEEVEDEVLTEVATGAGVVAFEVCVVTEAACAGTTSAVAGVGLVEGECARLIAAATPPGPPTTVPARAATVIAGYLRVQDDAFGSVRTIGLLRLCFE